MMIEAREVVHRYRSDRTDDVMALSGVDFRVARGEYVVVIGPNGSGKSTLAKHFNGLLLPDGGVVFVAGMDTRDPDHLWAVRQKAGMVFQNPDNQIVAAVVEEDVAFGPENLGLESGLIRQRVGEALQSVDMRGYDKHAPYALSGGQKQRVAIAGVLAMRPECIVLDEPTSMLDPTGRAEVLRTLRRLNQEEGMTVVHITHYMEEAVPADRVVVMDEGRVVLQGTPREVFSQVGELRRLGLDVPQVVELAHELRREGLDLPPGVLTVDELVTALCSG